MKLLDFVVLYSGGLDSFILRLMCQFWYKEKEVRYVFFDIGQPNLKQELRRVEGIAEVHKIDWIRKGFTFEGHEGSSSGNVLIPGRNTVMAALAASLYPTRAVCLGTCFGEHHEKATDKNEEHARLWTLLMSYSLKHRCELFLPLVALRWSKLDAVRWALTNGHANPEELHATWSCLSSRNDLPCGECVVCVRRWGIFGQLGIPEKYARPPEESDYSRELILAIVNSEHYDRSRKEEIIPYARRLGLIG